ncbi:hypothetical protein [Listeria seeligeri]|uniref:hypothetical protein n=1 Tax=Listeria seeligeri TaxID=1640 RepID=UPI0022EAC174|nr:hypothetical protein [Listeria seeligeri]
MKFIEINGVAGERKGPYSISVDKIVSISQANRGALVEMEKPFFFFTEETPEQIFELIKKAGAEGVF